MKVSAGQGSRESKNANMVTSYHAWQIITFTGKGKRIDAVPSASNHMSLVTSTASDTAATATFIEAKLAGWGFCITA